MIFTPISLRLATSGMETSLLIFLIGVAVYSYSQEKTRLYSIIAIGVLPWVRPDAIAISLLLIAAYSFKKKKIDKLSVTSLFLGTVTLIGFNYFYFGTILHNTVVAKTASYSPNRGLLTILQRITHFWSSKVGGIFSPVNTKFLGGFGVFFFILFISSMFFYYKRFANNRDSKIITLTYISIAILLPLAYMTYGVTFSWYFWPSKVLVYLIFWSLLVKLKDKYEFKYKKWVLTCTVIFLIGMLSVQFLVAVENGHDEKYRANIGRYIKKISQEGDTMFLEPAGYIPFYAERYTYDKVGIVSPVVIDYKRKYKSDWYIEFIKNFKPNYIVEREPLITRIIEEPSERNTKDVQWVSNNYTLNKKFTYDPEKLYPNSIFLPFLKLGSMPNFLVYKYAPHHTNQGNS